MCCARVSTQLLSYWEECTSGKSPEKILKSSTHIEGCIYICIYTRILIFYYSCHEESELTLHTKMIKGMCELHVRWLLKNWYMSQQYYTFKFNGNFTVTFILCRIDPHKSAALSKLNSSGLGPSFAIRISWSSVAVSILFLSVVLILFIEKNSVHTQQY